MNMKLSEIVITEARKNPDRNPKVPINDILRRKLNTTDDSIAGVPNLFVSFTNVDKLGINPKSHLAYDTPIGIYSYPASYVVKTAGSDTMSKLPFAGTQPHVNLFKATGNIINLATVGQGQVTEYYNKLDKILEPTGVNGRKQLREFVALSTKEALFPNYPGGQFWYVTMQVAKQFPGIFGKQPPIAWNKLMRMLKIDGVVDPGVGIVHTNEPTQGVFFSIEAVTSVERHANLYSQQQQARSVEHGALTKQDQVAIIQQLRAENKPEDVIGILKDKGWRYIKYINDAKLREIVVKHNPYAISHISKPTDREQLIALSYEFISALKHIKTINQDVIVQVIKDQPSTDKLEAIIDGLPNINEPLQMEIVHHMPRLVLKLKKPSKRVVQTAVDSWTPPAALRGSYAPGQLPKWLSDIAKQYGVR